MTVNQNLGLKGCKTNITQTIFLHICLKRLRVKPCQGTFNNTKLENRSRRHPQTHFLRYSASAWRDTTCPLIKIYSIGTDKSCLHICVKIVRRCIRKIINSIRKTPQDESDWITFYLDYAKFEDSYCKSFVSRMLSAYERLWIFIRE